MRLAVPTVSKVGAQVETGDCASRPKSGAIDKAMNAERSCMSSSSRGDREGRPYRSASNCSINFEKRSVLPWSQPVTICRMTPCLSTMMICGMPPTR